MATLKELYQLNERSDFQHIASELVKYYGLKSKIKFGARGKNEGEYDWDRDIINLRRSYPSVKEFIVSVLHELHHADQVRKYGRKRFLKKYIQASTMAVVDGFDRYSDNKWEKKAENWAKQEFNKRWKNKF
tara:strand:+ start:361 stop:753 length:393 start_codon:yes stop_codon:yes gene_type:complete